jgi:serine/threonine-protein kinase
MTSGQARPAAAEPEAVPPRRRRRVFRWLLPLVLVLAAVAGGVFYVVTRDRTHTYQVPRLAGLTEAEALNQISGFDWVTVVTREASDEVPTGIVIRTRPFEATSLEQHKQFQLVVSSGPAPRALLDLVGLTLEQATSSLDGLGLVLKQADPVFDESVPAGTVISWMVPEQPGLKAGDTVTPGTTVSVVLSAGPQPRVVPNLVGMTIEQATATLAEEGLVLAQLAPEFNDKTAAGLIGRQDLATGTSVDRGAVISIAVSKGPDVVAVPPLGGLTLQQATDALTTAGLVVGTVNGNTAGVLGDAQYRGVSVLPGQVLPRGSAIDITFA